VRELEHAIERAVVLSRGTQLELSLFPALPPPAPAAEQAAGPLVPGATLEEIEREAILRTLESVGGSTSRAAAILKISPRTIQYKIKQYRLGAVKVTGRRSQPGETPEAPNG
jgi:two-component system NtrC family response regulator/two-component system response regulator HydG